MGLKAFDSSGTTSEIKVFYKDQGPDSNLQFNEESWREILSKEVIRPNRWHPDFKEYEYEVESLEEFNTFSIKIVLQSSNSSNPPLIENFRANS